MHDLFKLIFFIFFSFLKTTYAVESFDFKVLEKKTPPLIKLNVTGSFLEEAARMSCLSFMEENTSNQSDNFLNTKENLLPDCCKNKEFAFLLLDDQSCILHENGHYAAILNYVAIKTPNLKKHLTKNDKNLQKLLLAEPVVAAGVCKFDDNNNICMLNDKSGHYHLKKDDYKEEEYLERKTYSFFMIEKFFGKKAFTKFKSFETLDSLENK